jgi:hypothetical protein
VLPGVASTASATTICGRTVIIPIITLESAATNYVGIERYISEPASVSLPDYNDVHLFTELNVATTIQPNNWGPWYQAKGTVPYLPYHVYFIPAAPPYSHQALETDYEG